MKVVLASTPGQEEKIIELINQFYTDVFPLYFSDDEIQEFKGMNILYTSISQVQLNGTLREAYQIIASLQTLISILNNERLDIEYIGMYYKNVNILEEYGLHFPFEYQQFLHSKMNINTIHMFSKPANEMLI